MSSECEGCKLYQYDNSECCCSVGIPASNHDMECPCRTCIVKPICNQVCNDLREHVRKCRMDETGTDFRFRIYAIETIRRSNVW